MGIIFQFIGRDFLVCWVPFHSKSVVEKMWNFLVSRDWLEFANQWLEVTRRTVLVTRPNHDSNSKNFWMTLTRRACDSDSTKITRTHDWCKCSCWLLCWFFFLSTDKTLREKSFNFDPWHGTFPVYAVLQMQIVVESPCFALCGLS